MIENSENLKNIEFWEDYILFVKRVLDRIKKEGEEKSKKFDKDIT